MTIRCVLLGHAWSWGYHLSCRAPNIAGTGKRECLRCGKHEEFDLLETDIAGIVQRPA